MTKGSENEPGPVRAAEVCLDTSVAYNVAGEDGSPTIVFLHGFASNARECWSDTLWLRDAQRHGFRTISVDLRGHGSSGAPADHGAYRAGKYLADLRAILDEEDADDISVVGFSFGALLALLLSASDRRVRSVVALGIGGAALKGAFDPGTADVLLGKLAPRSDREEFLALASRRHPQRLACLAQAANEFDLDASFGHHADSTPTLVIAGARDPFASDARKLVTLYSRAEVVSLERADHMGTLQSSNARKHAFHFISRTQNLRDVAVKGSNR